MVIIAFTLLASACYQSLMPALQVIPNVEAEFAGVYVFREVAGQAYGELYIETGRKFLGLFKQREPWWPEFPADFTLPPVAGSAPAADLRVSPPRFFQIRFTGVPGELNKIGVGATGRKRAVREVRITRVLDVKEVSGM